MKDNQINNIKTYDFHFPENIFYNSTLNPENEGFCDDNACLGNGVYNISKCFGGISGILSQPHFLNADEKFKNAFVGMNPDPEKHDAILHFEPVCFNFKLKLSQVFFKLIINY